MVWNMPDEKLPLIIPPGSKLAHSGPPNGRIISEMVSGALSFTQRPEAIIPRFKIGDHVLCEPDYRQIMLWSKQANWDPGIILTNMVVESEEIARSHNAAVKSLPVVLRQPDDFVSETCITKGRVINIACDISATSFEFHEWAPGLAIESALFFARSNTTLKTKLSNGVFSPNLPKLSRLECNSVGLHDLNLSRLPNLTKLWCGSNKLTILDLEPVPKLNELFCSHNQLANISFNSTPRLLTLWCSGNPISSLELNNVPSLTNLNCGATKIQALDLAPVPNLQGLNCQVCQLTNLNLSHVPRLTNLVCGGNPITKLNLGHVPELISLDCAATPIDDLDIRPLRLLKNLRYNKNRTRLIQRPDQHF